MRSRTLNWQEWQDLVLRTVRQVEETFTKPDDDWMPTLLVYGRGGLHVAPIAGAFFGTTEGKDYLAKTLLPKVIRQQNATAFALVISAWVVATSMDDTLATSAALADAVAGRIHERPDRVEMVIVQMADREHASHFTTKIKRFEDAPPQLEDGWDEFAAEEGASFELGPFTSRFMKPLVRALRPQG